MNKLDAIWQRWVELAGSDEPSNVLLAFVLFWYAQIAIIGLLAAVLHGVAAIVEAVK
jgi:hypothetical protein